MIDLSGCTVETLREGPDFTLRRERSPDGGSSYLTLVPTRSPTEPVLLKQLDNELRLSAHLHATWAVRPLEIQRNGADSVLVLEDPGGQPLDRALGQPLDVGSFLTLAIAATEALKGVHDAGIVHRNIKPQNLLTCGDAGLRITGFGFAMLTSDEALMSQSPRSIVGTLSHMSPEQTGRTNRPVDARSDLYSLGVVLYEMLTGQQPFCASEPIEWIHCHLAREPSRIVDIVPGSPVALDAIVSRLLAKSPEDRHQSANAVLGDLRSFLVSWSAPGRVDAGHALSPRAATPNRRERRQRRDSVTPPAPVNFQAVVDQLDVRAMLKASQALSAEIEPNGVVNEVMRVAVEHAGAERGLLVVLRDGAPRVLASAEVVHGRIQVLNGESAQIGLDLPQAALQHVLSTGTSMLVADASAHPDLSGDAYVMRIRPKSVLCVPLLKQARLVGALYLENNLLARAFSPERVTMLEFLASQAAISLENALLYADLKRSEAFLAEGQSLSNTGSWSLNVRTGRLMWSEQSYRIYERDPQLVNPPHVDEFVAMIHPDDLPEWRRTAHAAVVEGRVFAHEFRIVTGAGVVKHIHTKGRPVLDESGSVCDYIGTTMDVSDRKRSEDVLRETHAELAHVARLTTLGELAASIAHEVNQPLSAIVTNAETALMLLSRPAADIPSATRAVERVIRDGRQAGEVLQSIRAMLQKSKPEFTSLDINAVILEVLDLVRGELRQHAVALESELSADLRPLPGDRVQLQQVMLNLIKNSIEAMAGIADRPRILYVKTACDADDLVHVTVEDTGVGLDEITIQRLFEPFYTTKPQGMGIGLSICRSIVEAHGGQLRAACRLPFGGVFQFTLPRPDSDSTNETLREPSLKRT